jgi:hypothetical protein
MLLGMLLITSGCKSAPIKPVVTVCIIDYPRLEAICGETNRPELIEIEAVRRIPLSEMDRATAFTPAEWEKIQRYIHRLEDYAEENCK